MNKRTVIANLNKIANELDNSGMFNEATEITNVMKRLSQFTPKQTQPQAIPVSNDLSARAQAGQMGDAQAAQDFIEKNRLNPKLKTTQDFYYEAQKQGLSQSILNSISALAKAEGSKDLSARAPLDVSSENAQAAQDFIEKNRLNPKLKTAQDFYYEAQKQGLSQSILNSISALAKAEGLKDQTRLK